MPDSNSSFEGAFSDENIDTSDGDEDSSEEFGGQVAPVSRDRFGDEESDSEYSSEEDSSEGSSGSDSDDSYDDGQAEILKEQELLRGMTDVPSTSRSRRWYLIGLAIFCLLVLGLGVGLGVGLTRKKDSDEDTPGESSDADSTPTAPKGSAPSNPPVRMPVQLPNPPKIGTQPLPEKFNVRTPARAGTNIYRSGASADGEDGTVLVQGGDPENDDRDNVFALFELPVDIEAIRFAFDNDERSATFCLDLVDQDIPARTSTYSACLIDPDSVPTGGIEALTDENDNFLMPDDCAGTYYHNFEFSSEQSLICVDVTDMLYIHYLAELSGGLRRRRKLEDANVKKPLVMMIDNLSASTEPGDKFVTANSYLDVAGERFPDCKTITDLICSETKFSILCAQVKSAKLDGWLSDNALSVTLFAPTDDAFLTMPGGTAITQNVDNLSYILDTHLAGGEIQSSAIDCSVEALPPLRMVNGELTTVTCDSDSISISGGGNNANALPKIIDPDLDTCNGIIHAIDEVILPAILPTNEDEDSEDEVAECLTIGEVICSNEELAAICTFYNLFREDPLVGAIFETADVGETTLFLPNNSASMVLQTMAGDSQRIATLLSNHASQGSILADALECDADLAMLGGETTKTVCEGDDKFQVGGSQNGANPKIIVSDILYCTGVVHIINDVILTGSMGNGV